MQHPSPSLISTLVLPTSMEINQHLSCESFSYSIRHSFDAESFIEFDPKLMSLRWRIKAQEGGDSDYSLDVDSIPLPCLSLDSTKSLLSRSNRFESRYFHAVPSVAVAVSSGSAKSKQKHKFRLGFQKHLWFLLMKVCGRMREMKLARRIAGGSSAKVASIEGDRRKKVFDVGTENSINDAVLHCKNSNLSSLTEEELCKA